MVGYDAFGSNRNERTFNSFNFFVRGDATSSLAPSSSNRRWLAVVDGSTQKVLYNQVLPDAFDGELLSTADIAEIRAAVNMAELPAEMETFSSWAEANISDVNSRNETADPDADGMTNLLEYAYGTNPEQADSELGPQVIFEEGSAKLRYQRSIMAQVTPLAIMAGDDLRFETPFDPEGLEEVSEVSGGVETVTVTLPSSEESRYFLRLSTSPL